MGLVYLENFSHSNGEKKLYENTNFRLNRKEHIALIGPNGAGKTTLLNIITGKIMCDKGQLKIHPKTKIGYLDQHQEVDNNKIVDDYLKESFSNLFELEKKMLNLYEKITIDYKEDDLVKALSYQEILNSNGFDEINKKIGNLVTGLGISLNLLSQKMGELSGGQRAKVMMAKLLLSENDFLLLDEPTNFLDLEQVKWLAKFLQSYEKAFILVSHDKDFINRTCDIIYALDNFKLTRYVGNYDKYVQEFEIQKDQYDKAFEAQQKEIKKLEKYVAKNKARASTAKSAQSRQKQLDKMEVMSERRELIKFKFNFSYKRPSTNVIVRAEDLVIGYDFPLLHPLNFELREGEKCIISGKNGIGKTTFLKTLASEIKPFSGKVHLGNAVQYAYFQQIENNSEFTPIEYLMNKFSDITEHDARTKIAQFGIRNDLMNQKMKDLSGGEQTRVRLSAISMVPCSLIILDEPTNHIDILAKQSLLEAIENFKGTIILTTHDINFSTNWANKTLDFSKLL